MSKVENLCKLLIELENLRSGNTLTKEQADLFLLGYLKCFIDSEIEMNPATDAWVDNLSKIIEFEVQYITSKQ